MLIVQMVDGSAAAAVEFQQRLASNADTPTFLVLNKSDLRPEISRSSENIATALSLARERVFVVSCGPSLAGIDHLIQAIEAHVHTRYVKDQIVLLQW